MNVLNFASSSKLNFLLLSSGMPDYIIFHIRSLLCIRFCCLEFSCAYSCQRTGTHSTGVCSPVFQLFVSPCSVRLCYATEHFKLRALRERLYCHDVLFLIQLCLGSNSVILFWKLLDLSTCSLHERYSLLNI